MMGCLIGYRGFDWGWEDGERALRVELMVTDLCLDA
jgi:hypothetical protein